MRLPWPMWGVWNPSKVLPEILEPLCGYIAAFVVYPISGDYVASIAFTESIIISVFIAVFFAISFKYFKENFLLSSSLALCIELLFFLSFFLIFKQKNLNSYYGFWAPDMNCYFNYIVPSVLNASIILWMSKSRNLFHDHDKTCKYGVNRCIFGGGGYIICVYLAIFSNIQSSILLSGYCFIKLVEVSAKSLIDNKKIFSSKEIWIYIAVILLWMISLLFEASGQRAMGLTKNTTNFFTIPLSKVLDQYSVLLSRVGKYYFYLFLILEILAGFILLIDRNIRKKYIASITRIVLLFFLVILYLTLLHAKAGILYGSRVDAMWPAIFLVLMLSCIFIAIIFTKLISFQLCLIPMIFISFFVAFNLNGKFIQFRYDYDTSKKINDYIIDQILVADKKGQPRVEVKIPQIGRPGSWPYPFEMANWLQNALYSHNMISNRMRMKIVPDPAVNKMFYKTNVETAPFTDLELAIKNPHRYWEQSRASR